MSGKSFRRVALLAWFMQALIVVSGAAVRLTEAGLGCEDWPTCNEDRVLPEWQLHGLIEFGNRLISALVALSAVAVVVAAHRRRPRRADLIRYAWAVVAGTMLQVVLGGVTVLLDLHPIVVSVHFLLSMGLLWAAQVLWFRAGPDRSADEATEPIGEALPADAGRKWSGDVTLLRALPVLASAVLLTGTVVTGTGPNSGDSRADRLGFELETVARIHSAFVWCLIAALVMLAVRTARSRLRRSDPLDGPTGFTVLNVLLAVVVAQGAIGYTQFALGAPALLVELHVIGAVAVWSLSILLHLQWADGRPRQAAGTVGAVGATAEGATRPEEPVSG